MGHERALPFPLLRSQLVGGPVFTFFQLAEYRVDRLAASLQLDPTLIATRSQLTLLARDPASASTVLLPWQARLFTSDPAWGS